MFEPLSNELEGVSGPNALAGGVTTFDLILIPTG